MTFEPKHILVPVAIDPGEDFSLAEHSLMVACDIALKFNSKIALLHLAPSLIAGGGPGVDILGQAYDSLSRILQERLAHRKHKMEELQRLAQIKGISVEGRVVDSLESTASVICQAAQELKMDLIVIGSHGRTGLSRMLFGSVAEKVAQHTKCPILLLHPLESQARDE